MAMLATVGLVAPFSALSVPSASFAPSAAGASPAASACLNTRHAGAHGDVVHPARMDVRLSVCLCAAVADDAVSVRAVVDGATDRLTTWGDRQTSPVA